MTTTSISTFDATGFEQFVEARPNEPQWLTDLRRESFSHAEAMEWPNRRSEEWIRTDNRIFQLKKYSPPSVSVDPIEVPNVAQLREGIDPGGSMQTVDSQIASEVLDDDLVGKGVLFGSLDRFCTEAPDKVRPFLYTVVDPDYDKFAALHAAFWSGGQFLYVPKGVIIEKPLYIGSVMSDGGIDTSHTLIVLEDGAEATVIHECNSVDPAAGGLHMGAIEIVQKPNSHLRYVNVQEWGHKTYHFAHQKATVDRDSTLQWTVAAMGAGLAKVN
jgi:Fe-S cluster assembly protein SufD